MKTNIYIGLMVIALLAIIAPDLALAISEIDSEITDFKDWLIDDVAEPLAVIFLVLWILNAFTGYWKGGTDWRIGIGLAFLNIILFSAEKVVSSFG